MPESGSKTALLSPAQCLWMMPDSLHIFQPLSEQIESSLNGGTS